MPGVASKLLTFHTSSVEVSIETLGIIAKGRHGPTRELEAKERAFVRGSGQKLLGWH